MFKQIKLVVQNGLIAKNYFIFFEHFAFVWEPLTKSWYDVPTTQMSIFLLHLTAGVLFEGAFSLWTSLRWTDCYEMMIQSY